jgi:pyruvate formate lyase activating enzyme
LKFAGFIKSSFVDYPNEISAVVFTSGCNFNCWYCHNQGLINGKIEESEMIDEKEILDFLNKRKGLLDGLVISGGEPTLHSDLKDFIRKVKKLGFKVKLDTNGTNPKLLQDLIDKRLIDFVAMDIKTTLEKYNDVIGKFSRIEDVKTSISILMNSNIDYEFRTTFAPGISVEDIENIAKMIAGARVMLFKNIIHRKKRL